MIQGIAGDAGTLVEVAVRIVVCRRLPSSLGRGRCECGELDTPYEDEEVNQQPHVLDDQHYQHAITSVERTLDKLRNARRKRRRSFMAN